MKAVCA